MFTFVKQVACRSLGGNAFSDPPLGGTAKDVGRAVSKRFGPWPVLVVLEYGVRAPVFWKSPETSESFRENVIYESCNPVPCCLLASEVPDLARERLDSLDEVVLDGLRTRPIFLLRHSAAYQQARSINH